MLNSNTVAKYGRFTKRPCPDIPGSVNIGVRFVIARAAPKLLLVAIFFCAMTTFGASSAGIARIDGDQRNTYQGGLIRQKQSQLRESPGMQNRTLLAPGLDPFANSTEFFDGDPATGAFSFGNDLLANNMIGVRGEPSLTPGKKFKSAFRGSRLLVLKLRAQPGMPISYALNLGARAPQPVGVCGNICNPKINTQEVARINWDAIGKVDRAVQIEFPLAINQFTLALDSVEAFLLVLAINQRNYDPPLRECPQAHPIRSLESHDALIVSDSTVRFKCRALSFVPTEALDCLTDGPDGHLGRQPETQADLCIGQFVDVGLIEDFGIKPKPRRERSGFIVSLHRVQQSLGLFGVGEQPQLERELHCLGVYHSVCLKERWESK